MAEYEDSKDPIIQTWTLKIYCSCVGCEKNVKRVLRDIDGVQNVSIDPGEQKATVTGTLVSADVLLKKLKKECGKHTELWPATQNKQKNESKTQNQHKQQNSGKDEERTAMAQREMQRKKPKDPKQQTEQKPGNDGAGNASNGGGGKAKDNAAEAQSKMQNRTLKTQKEQNSGRHEDNGQVVEDALEFTREALFAATNNFDSGNKIGEGGFGPVYKGTTGGKEIAVKRWLSTSKQGRDAFLSEKVLAKLQHRNIVKLLGCCEQGSEMLIVYEYFPKGNLEKWVSDPKKREELNLDICYGIILGIARGLSYLNEDSQPRIVHGDIKPSNILLDDNLNPKITDFGTAKVLREDTIYVSPGDRVGTLGYVAPEYYGEGQLSPKADVYSFGIVLLELLTGKKMTSKSQTLYGGLRSSDKPDNILGMIDPTIFKTCDKEKASRCIQVGLLCIQKTPGCRPLMSQVTAMLLTPTSLIQPVPTNPRVCNWLRRKVKGSKVNPVIEACDSKVLENGEPRM